MVAAAALGAGEGREDALEFADPSRQIIVIAGVPFNTAGSTNILRVAPCDERLIYRTDPE